MDKSKEKVNKDILKAKKEMMEMLNNPELIRQAVIASNEDQRKLMKEYHAQEKCKH